MDTNLRNHIVSVCSALGGFEDIVKENGEIVKVYRMGDECLDCLRDLRRFLKQYDTPGSRQVARILWQSKVLTNDLIPLMLETLPKGEGMKRIIIACLELFVQLTWPIDFEQDFKDEDGILDEEYTILNEALITYKQALMNSMIFKGTLKLLILPLSLPRRDRIEKDDGIIRLILFFYRNLAAIRDIYPNTSSSTFFNDRANLQSDLIIFMKNHKILDLLITLASNSSSSDFIDFNVLVLDTLYNLYKGIDMEKLFDSSSKNKQLGNLLLKENFAKRKAIYTGSTRHNRFGTTVQLNLSDGVKYILHKQNSISNPGPLLMDTIKKKKFQKRKQTNQFDTEINLKIESLEILKIISNQILLSSFNPFFESLVKDFISERPKIKESDHLRFHYLTKFFLSYFILKNENDFTIIGSILRLESFVFTIKRIRMSLEERQWSFLHAAMEAFTGMLKIVIKMGESEEEDFRDIADNLQSNLFYEQSTIELIFMCCKSYRDQSLGYLTSIIEMIHTFTKMIERYSNGKDHMYVRKKRTKNVKKINQNQNIYDNVEEEEEDQDLLPINSYTERSFAFNNFEIKFANLSIMDTYIAALQNYRLLTSDQIKHIVLMLHRVFVKLKGEKLLYRLSIIELFGRIQDDIPHLPQNEGYKELSKFISYFLKRLFKSFQSDSLLYIEILYPPQKVYIKGKERYIDSDTETGDSKEYRFTNHISENDEIEAATAFLLKNDQKHILLWIRDIMSETLKNRKDELDPETETYGSEVLVSGDTPERAKALENGKVSLLLESLNWQCVQRDTKKEWIIPGIQSGISIRNLLSKLENSISKNAILHSGKRITEFIRKKPAKRSRSRKRIDNSDDEEDDFEFEEKVNRKKRKEEEEKQYKSAAFIEDSDDDNEANEEFFQRELELRERMRLENEQAVSM